MKNIDETTQWMIFGLEISMSDKLDKVFTRGPLRDSISSKLKETINTSVNDVLVSTSGDTVGE